MSVYKVIGLVGACEFTRDDAAKNAVEAARKYVRELRIGEVTYLGLED